MNLDQFHKNLPDIVCDLVSFFRKRGLEFTVVGGIPRDYLISSHVGTDWDVEISSQEVSFSVSFWKEIAKDLKVFGDVSFLSYQIIRLKTTDLEFEFSPPRKEIFNTSLNHKNFEAEFDFSLDSHMSWQRRDLSINAIGFKIFKDSIDIVDPFNGLKSIKSKTIHPCSKDFSLDPVRLLRAFRFKVRLAFEFSEEMVLVLKNMRGDFSAHYLYSEMIKSKSPYTFYSDLVSFGVLGLPVSSSSILTDSFKLSLIEQGNLYSWLFSLCLVQEDVQGFSKYFGLSAQLEKKISSFYKLNQIIETIEVRELKNEFEVVKNVESLNFIFSWYYSVMQFRSKNETSFIEEYVKLNSQKWSSLLSLLPLKDVKFISPEYRAKYIVWDLCQRI